MAATTDFVHDEQIVEAVIAQLNQELPSAWVSGYDPNLRLRQTQFGDLRDYRFSPGENPRSICPVILVRLNRSESAPAYGGLGGKAGQVVPVRLLHVRTRGQCRDLNDLKTIVSPARARAQYAKIISKALFANRDLGQPVLTTDDTSARIVELRPKAVLYETGGGDIEVARQHDLVAVAIDFEVVVRTE